MSEIVDRVAAAIYPTAFNGPEVSFEEGEKVDFGIDDLRAQARRAARAAIEAMRKTTLDMAAAGYEAHYFAENNCDPRLLEIKIYHAMIDEALK